MTGRKKTAREQSGLGIAVRELRERQGISRPELARRAGLSAGFIEDIERRGQNLTWASSRPLAQALDVSHPQLAELADRHEKEFARPQRKKSKAMGPFRVRVEKVVPRGC